jgi:hypothetical protein
MLFPHNLDVLLHRLPFSLTSSIEDLLGHIHLNLFRQLGSRR